MDSFKGLFGNKNQQNSSAHELQAEFDDDWYKAVQRFAKVAGFGSFSLNVKHPQTRQPITPHEGLGGTFEDWQKIQSPWDRRSLLFLTILETVGKSMKAWQIANILTSDRRPNNALELLQKSGQPVPQQ